MSTSKRFKPPNITLPPRPGGRPGFDDDRERLTSHTYRVTQRMRDAIEQLVEDGAGPSISAVSSLLLLEGLNLVDKGHWLPELLTESRLARVGVMLDALTSQRVERFGKKHKLGAAGAPALMSIALHVRGVIEAEPKHVTGRVHAIRYSGDARSED